MKKLQVLFVLLFTVFFSYTVIAQEAGFRGRNHRLNFPEKIHNPLGTPLAAGTYTAGSRW